MFEWRQRGDFIVLVQQKGRIIENFGCTGHGHSDESKRELERQRREREEAAEAARRYRCFED